MEVIMDALRYSPLPRWLILQKVGDKFETQKDLEMLLDLMKSDGFAAEDEGPAELSLTELGRQELERLEEERSLALEQFRRSQWHGTGCNRSKPQRQHSVPRFPQ